MNSTTRQNQRRGKGRNNLSDLEWLAKGFRKHVGHIARIVRHNTKETCLKKQALDFQQQLSALTRQNEALNQRIRYLEAENQSLRSCGYGDELTPKTFPVSEYLTTEHGSAALESSCKMKTTSEFSSDETSLVSTTCEKQQKCCLNNVNKWHSALFTTDTTHGGEDEHTGLVLSSSPLGIEVKVLESHPVPCHDTLGTAPDTSNAAAGRVSEHSPRNNRKRSKPSKKNTKKQDPGSCDIVAYQKKQSEITVADALSSSPVVSPKTRTRNLSLAGSSKLKTHSFFLTDENDEEAETEPVSITYVNDLAIQCVHCDTKCEQYYFTCSLCDAKSCQYCITSGASKCGGKKFKVVGVVT